MNGMYGGMPPGGCGGGMMMQGCGMPMAMGGCAPMAMGGCAPMSYGMQTVQMGAGPMMAPMGGASYGGCMPMAGQQMMMTQGMGPPAECEVLVEVTPQVAPNFNRTPDGGYVFELGPISVQIVTQCMPQPPVMPGSPPPKPVEEFMIEMPRVQQVLFNPMQNMPPGLMAQDETQKRGAVLEVPANVGLNAQLKANSVSGSLILEDLQVTGGYQQKVGENTLHYRCQVDGQLAMNTQKVQQGAHRLEVELEFKFMCQLDPNSSMPTMMMGAPGGMPPPMDGGGMMPQQMGGMPPPMAGGGMMPQQMGGQGMPPGGGMAQMGGGLPQGPSMGQIPQGHSMGQMPQGSMGQPQGMPGVHFG